MNHVLVLFTLLLLKHFIADFVLQLPYMLEQKGHYGAKGGIDHALLHSWGTMLVLVPALGLSNLIVCFMLALFDGITHYHIDWVKVNFAKGFTPADRQFWVWIGADQLMHQLTYIIIIGIIVA